MIRGLRITDPINHQALIRQKLIMKNQVLYLVKFTEKVTDENFAAIGNGSQAASLSDIVRSYS